MSSLASAEWPISSNIYVASVPEIVQYGVKTAWVPDILATSDTKAKTYLHDLVISLHLLDADIEQNSIHILMLIINYK